MRNTRTGTPHHLGLAFCSILPYVTRFRRLGREPQTGANSAYDTMTFMSQAAPAITRAPSEVVRQSPVSQAANGICYAISGDVTVSEADLERMVSAVPCSAATALERKAYYFVP